MAASRHTSIYIMLQPIRSLLYCDMKPDLVTAIQIAFYSARLCSTIVRYAGAAEIDADWDFIQYRFFQGKLPFLFPA